MINRIIIIFLLTSRIFAGTGSAQEPVMKETVLTVKTGMSLLVTEIYGDLSGAANEFNSMPGPYAGIELSHFFTDALEAGGEMSFAVLRGKAVNPEFSAIGHQYFLDESLSEPVQYNNRLWGPQLFARYHFGRNDPDSRKLTWFIKAGAGILFHQSKLFYSNRTENEILFGKGRGDFKYGNLTTGVFVAGGGLNHKITDVIGLKIAADFNMIGYDFLDVVHNFDEAGNRRNIIGVFTNLSAGVSVKLNNLKVINNEHLPFTP